MIDAEVLVIGSGFAGLWAAIAARDAGAENVAVIDKSAIGMSSQSKLSAGATVYCLPDDNLDLWVHEYAEAQNWLSRQDMVTDILASSYDRLRKLEGWGVEYERMGDNYLRLPSRGFRHVQMMVRPRWRKRVGGSAVVAALRHQLIRRKIARYPHRFVTDLLMAEGRAGGALTVDRYTGETETFSADAVVLAASDCSFRGNYACADAVTGDAFRLAYDVGARLSNMEFLCVNTGSPSYGFEGTGIALRYGGKLVDRDGRQFMAGYHPEADGAEVNVLVQAMAHEAQKGNGPFYLDFTAGRGSFLEVALDQMGGFMPVNVARLRERGIDIFAEPQEWVPAIQTLRGGVRTDLNCLSDVPGLYAAGLSQAVDPCLFNGWSSMRAMWAGEKAGKAAAGFAADTGAGHGTDAGHGTIDADEMAVKAAAATSPLRKTEGPRPDDVLVELQKIVFPWGVSILKTRERLSEALSSVESLEVSAMRAEDPHELAKFHETRNMVAVAEMFLRASLERTESRTDHFREDYPEADNLRWLKWVNLRRGDGAMTVTTEPVPFERYRFRPPAEPSAAGAEAAGAEAAGSRS